jgi:hypothetical protein
VKKIKNVDTLMRKKKMFFKNNLSMINTIKKEILLWLKATKKKEKMVGVSC